MYEDTHRKFLQMIIHAGIMSEYEIKQTAAKIFDYDSSASFHIATINVQLEPFAMMIKSGCSEFTGEQYYTLMSTTVDAVTKFQTEFTQAQLELLRKVFAEILASPDGNASSIVCLNFCQSMENRYSMMDAEQFLQSIVQRKWLDFKEGFYYMGVRSIIELMPYFRSTHQEGFNNCPLCKLVVFHGRRCEQCQVVAHLYCLATFAKIQNPLRCTNCNGVLSSEDLPDVPEPATNLEETTGTGAEPSQKRMKRSSQFRTDR